MKLFYRLKGMWFHGGENGSYYRESLIVVLLITSVPTFAIAVSTYFIGMKQVETEVLHKNHYQLEQVFQRLDEQFSQLEMVVDKGAANPIFDETLRDTNVIDEFPLVRDMYRYLSVLQSSNQMIFQIDLYLKNQGLLFANDRGTFRLNEDPNKASYERILDSPELIQWKNIGNFYQGGAPSFPLVLIHKIPAFSTRPYGALLVYLNKSIIDKEITQLNPYENSISFMIRPNGEWITAGKSADANEKLLKEYIKDQIVKRESASDSFTVKWEGTEYSVAYATFSRTGWHYMIATPLQQLMAPITLTSKLMLGVSSFGILIAVLLSLLASQRMYRPIKRLVQMFGEGMGNRTMEDDRSDEIKFIENKWLKTTRQSQMFRSLVEENAHNMKKGFFLQLVQGHLYFFSEEELRERMDRYGWDTAKKGFLLILIQLSPFVEAGKRFLEGDDYLVTFAAANIIEEFSIEMKNVEVINLHNLSVCLLVSFALSEPQEQFKREIFSYCNDLIALLGKLLGVQVSVGVSKTVDEIKALPKSLNEVVQCLHFRNIGEQGQILHADELITQLRSSMDYPFQIEKELIHALQMGAEENTILKLNEFVQAVKQNGGNAFQIQQYMAQLLGRILRAMMQLGVPLNTYNRGVNLYEQLFGLREMDQIHKWFVNKVIRPYIKSMIERQDIETRQTIRQVLDIIDEEYMQDISLEYLSQRIGLLPKRLSAVFAQVTGQNFVDYVTNVRLERSKELLINTDLKVNDIASRVGYQTSYFIKIFKKSQGMTPGEYRDSGQGL
jgi:AraC-like DNA-binding protein